MLVEMETTWDSYSSIISLHFSRHVGDKALSIYLFDYL